MRGIVEAYGLVTFGGWALRRVRSCGEQAAGPAARAISRRRMLKLIGGAGACCALACVPGTAAWAQAPKMPHARYEVGVWYPGWDTPGTSEYESVSENIATIDKVSPYWYSLKPNGSVAAYGWAEDPELLSLARSNDKPVAPLVTNEFDPARVARMLATRSSRDAHAEDLTDLVMRKDYAGLDLDYEMLRAGDRDRFSAFVEDLASRLHDRGKKLSIAVHPKSSEPGIWDGPKAQDWERLGRAVDEFEVMTYDYHWNGSEAGPMSPLRWIDQVLDFAVTRVEPRKVRMGLPFYGRDWRGTEAKDLVYSEVRALAERYPVTVRRDPSGEPYYAYRDGHVVYYQDHRSIGAKLDVLVRHYPAVGGVAIWHVGGEDRRYWKTIRNKLGREPGGHRRRKRSS